MAWLDEDPLRQVEIAKRLKISRAAVSQRRKLLLSELRRLHPDALMEQDHVPETLDTEEEDDDDLSLEDFIRSFLKGSRRMRSYKLPPRGHP